MLVSLSIQNYAIIRNLEVSFEAGFSVVTGETGAGKSIILGALSLILGQRAETNLLKDESQKCIVEGRFLVADSMDLQNFFTENDLDFELPVLLRREILPAGKSRAFINDTPVSLTVLRELGLQLIDIHSQHSNLELGKRTFQLQVIDLYAANSFLLEDYRVKYDALRKLEKEFEALKETEAREKADYDYHLFQFNQLDEARLISGEQKKLEEEQEILNHSEEIKEGLGIICGILDGDELAMLPKMKETVSVLNKMKAYLQQANVLHQRMESTYFELRDIADECQHMLENTPHDTERLTEVVVRLDTIYTLMQKHRVATEEELIEIRNALSDKLQAVASFDDELAKIARDISSANQHINQLGEQLRERRLSVLLTIEDEITGYLQQLGIPNAVFKIELEKKTVLTASGYDEAIFLFNANKGGRPEEISKVASGGEMSRLMLAIKTVVAKSKALPAIVFDEIDTGISGETALKMAEILKQMSCYMQVINITHLPQIAAKGDHHFFVFKNDNHNGVQTGMRLLSAEERTEEIAKMLSGDKPNEAAYANARSLLNR